MKAISAALLAILLVAGVRVAAYAISAGIGQGLLSRLTATLSTTASPAPTQTPGAWTNVVFQDPLTSDRGGWANDARCSFASDGYHVAPNYVCYAPTSRFQDAQVSVTVTQQAGDPRTSYGLVVRANAPSGNEYHVLIDSNGYWGARKITNNAVTDVVPAVKTSAVHQGLNQINRLRVRMTGTHFVFFINDTQVGQATDATYPSGNVGVVAVGEDSGSVVVFTNFVITLP